MERGHWATTKREMERCVRTLCWFVQENNLRAQMTSESGHVFEFRPLFNCYTFTEYNSERLVRRTCEERKDVAANAQWLSRNELLHLTNPDISQEKPGRNPQPEAINKAVRIAHEILLASRGPEQS